MASPTKRKGDLGAAMIMADLLDRGFQVLLPFSEDAPYDLVIDRDGRFERVQCKHAASRAGRLAVKCVSSKDGYKTRYTAGNVEWLAAWDAITRRCFYIPGAELGAGRTTIHLRLTPARNGQVAGIWMAEDYLTI